MEKRFERRDDALAGTQLKFSVQEWPYATCERRLGGCGHTSRGKPVD